MSRLVKQTLLAGSVIMIGMNLFTRVFGFLREAVIADRFGTSALLDTFVLAFTLPELLSFIVFAAVPSALIPIRTRVLQLEPGAESGLFWNGAAIYAALLGALSLILFFARADLLNWLAPTLPPAQTAQGLRLGGILAWFLLFRGLEAYCRGWLFAHKHFVVPSMSAMVINIVVLVTIIAFYGEIGIESLAYGWLAGSVVAFIANGVFTLKVVKPDLAATLSRSVAWPLLQATIIVAVIESVALVYPVVDRYLAARYLGDGQISALRYAVFLIHIPTGIFIVAFSSATFPWIADLSQSDQREKLVSLYRQSVRLIIFTMLFIVAAIVMFSPLIIEVAFKRGAFDAVSQGLTSSALVFYALGIVFYSVYMFQMRFYYARRLLLRLLTILSGMLLLKILLSGLLVKPMGHDGLALATAITWAATMIVMTIDMARSLGGGVVAVYFKPLPRLAVCVAGLVVLWYWVLPQDSAWLGDSLWAKFAQLLLITAAGVIVYFGLAVVVRLPEPRRMLDTFVRKIRKNSSAPS